MIFRIEASTTAKPCLPVHAGKVSPTRSARGAKIDSVSCAILRRLVWSAMKSIVRCCPVSQFNEQNTDIPAHRLQQLRKFSACLLFDCISRRVSFVTPSTRQISAPPAPIFYSVSRPHHAACRDDRLRRDACQRICATSSGWVK